MQPWRTVAVKPGMNFDAISEACETHLLYLGGSLFGELIRKNITSLPALVDLNEIHEAHVLYSDNSTPKMYIKHAKCTDFNRSNIHVPENLQSFISPMDTTVFLPTTSSIFDDSYALYPEDVK